MPRAPRLTGCEHHLFFYDISWRPTAAWEVPCSCLIVSFSVVFRFLYFSAFVVFLFGTICALTDQLCVATTARPKLPITAAGAPPLGALTFCVRQEIYPVLLLFRSSSPVQDSMQSPCLLGYRSRGGGAESHTYSPHDARSIRISVLRFRQRTSSIPLALFIHSACQLPEGTAPKQHDNKVLLSPSQK